MNGTLPINHSAEYHSFLRRDDSNKASRVTMNDAPAIHTNLDSFLASVEKRAFVMARIATGDDDSALDIVQDSMFKLVEKYSEKPPVQWPPLFFRVLKNRITDHHRKRGFGRMVQWFGQKHDEEETDVEPVDQLTADALRPDQQLDSDQIGETLQQVLMTLPLRQQQTFMLRLWQGLSVSETSSALGISEGSVKTHLSRALQAMKQNLPEYLTA